MDFALQKMFGWLRLSLGWLFLWAFLDKVWGLGFSTTPEKSWLAGVSPTFGFLKMAAKGPFEGLYHAIGGHPVVDFLFMLALLCLGVSLLLGVGMKVAGYAGALLMLLMWTAVLPKTTNPFLDEHVIYLLLLLAFARMPVGHWLGCGAWWSETSLVKKWPWLA